MMTSWHVHRRITPLHHRALVQYQLYQLSFVISVIFLVLLVLQQHNAKRHFTLHLLNNISLQRYDDDHNHVNE